MLAKFGTNAGGATWWSNLELIQVEPHAFGQIWNQCKWHYMLAKSGTNTSGTTCWPNLEPTQLKFYNQYPGSVVPVAMFLVKIAFVGVFIYKCGWRRRLTGGIYGRKLLPTV